MRGSISMKTRVTSHRSAARSPTPMTLNGGSVAVLSFYSCEVNAFDDTHRQLVTSVGAALARTTARLSDVLAGPDGRGFKTAHACPANENALGTRVTRSSVESSSSLSQIGTNHPSPRLLGRL